MVYSDDRSDICAKDQSIDKLVTDENNNIIQTLLSFVAIILRIIFSWEISVGTAEFQLFQQQFGNTNDPNDIIRYGTGKQTGKCDTKLNGNKKNNGRNNGNGNNNQNNNNNGNHQHNNQNNNSNNNRNGKDDQKESNSDGDYKCNVPSHAGRIKQLEWKIRLKDQEIDALKIKLQQQTQFNSFMTKQILSIPINDKQNQGQIKYKNKDRKPSPDSIINPSKKLTQKVIAIDVEEKFVNAYKYMKDYMLLHGDQAIAKCNNDRKMVIDYNFHSKQESKETETESLVESL